MNDDKYEDKYEVVLKRLREHEVVIKQHQREMLKLNSIIDGMLKNLLGQDNDLDKLLKWNKIGLCAIWLIAIINLVKLFNP